MSKAVKSKKGILYTSFALQEKFRSYVVQNVKLNSETEFQGYKSWDFHKIIFKISNKICVIWHTSGHLITHMINTNVL